MRTLIYSACPLKGLEKIPEDLCPGLKACQRGMYFEFSVTHICWPVPVVALSHIEESFCLQNRQSSQDMWEETTTLCEKIEFSKGTAESGTDVRLLP